MRCRYCAAELPPGSGRLCHFHRKTLRLAREGRCIWCQRSPAEADWPLTSRRSSFCSDCLASRVRQRGVHSRLVKAIAKAAA